MNTPCKECVFAVYEEDTQVGCKRGMIDKYRSIGAHILEAYDEQKEFYVIENRLCPSFRTKVWLENIDKVANVRGVDDIDTQDLIDRVLSVENVYSYHVMTIFKDDDLDSLGELIKSVEDQDFSPVQLTIIRPIFSKIKVQELREFIKSKYNGKWRLENLILNKTDDEIFHQAQKSVDSTFLVMIDSGKKIEGNTLFSSINKTVAEDLKQFILIEGDGIKIISVTVYSYWYFNGNTKKSIVDNIKEYDLKEVESGSQSSIILIAPKDLGVLWNTNQKY